MKRNRHAVNALDGDESVADTGRTFDSAMLRADELHLRLLNSVQSY